MGSIQESVCVSVWSLYYIAIDMGYSTLLTHYGSVKPRGDIDSGQHEFRRWCAAWRHQATNRTNADLSLGRPRSIHPTATSHRWLPRYQSSWGQHWAHLGPVGPRWAPCRPHESCYQGYLMQWLQQHIMWMNPHKKISKGDSNWAI